MGNGAQPLRKVNGKAMTNTEEPIKIVDVDVARLEELAMSMHRALPHHVIIGLRGTLGAGKTRFVQAFAVAAGIEQSLVTSPTFPIVQHYQGERRIHHIDAYRLADEDEFIELGGEELLEEDATILIEWPDRIRRSLPQDRITIDFEVDERDEAKRIIRIECRDRELRDKIAVVVK
jgi:tRNA threonylcarbamoyladenosine biosynthesis protein TsaE